jgi:putative ABC transport system permease protein
MPDWAEHLRPHLDRLRLDGSRQLEIAEELSQHLDQRLEELLRSGMSESEARRVALAELSEPVPLSAAMTPLRQAAESPAIVLGAPGASLLSQLRQDLRYALRMLRKNPGFAAVVILTLALGIGANSAIFALVDATLLRPLPFHEPQQLVLMWERTPTTARARVSALNMLDWASRSRTFASIGGYVPNVGGMVMNGRDGMADTVARQWVTSSIFDALGVKAIAGRTFDIADDTQQRNVVVLAEAFWRERFNGDRSIIGREIRLDGSPYTIVGVVPREAQVLGRTSIWALFPITGAPPQSRGQYGLVAVGRLKSGVSLEAGQSDISAVAAGLAREFADTNANRTVALQALEEAILGAETHETSMLFIGVVGLVLLICSANVASLQLTRATVRQRELAVRAALGADRRRMIRQLLTESLVLSTLGGVLGLAVSAVILALAPQVMPREMLPATVTLSIDGRVAVFCAVTALCVGVLFGVAPAWQAASIAGAQAASGTRTATGHNGRIRQVLVAGQVATAVALLFGAGLLLRTLLAVDGVSRGYNSEQVLSMVVDPMSETYPTDAAELQFYQAVEQEIRALPGVRGVAWATTQPLGRSYEGVSFVELEGQAPVADARRVSADMQIVSPTFFETLGVPMVAGRAFDDRDAAGKVPVCIVNEAFVRRVVPAGVSPIGKRVLIRQGSAPGAAAVAREIVGVARQVKGSPAEREELVQTYVPMAQDTPGDVFLLVTPTAGRAEALAMPVRSAIARVDTAQLVSVRDVMTLDDVVADANARHRFRAVLVMTFAGLALLLAMVGLFGILAYSVQQRIREFGVRRALGGSTRHVVTLVLSSVAWVIGAGAVAGLAASYLMGRLIASMLFGVRPGDPVTYVAVAMLLLLGALASAIGPAWRAARVEPALALRHD